MFWRLVMPFRPKLPKKILGALVHSLIGIFFLVLTLILLPIPFADILSAYNDPFWVTSSSRIFAILVFAMVYFPLVLALIKMYSLSDKRYTVANRTVPDAIFGGLKETGLLLCATWVFIQSLLVCYL